MAEFLSMFGPLVSCYSLAPADYETIRTHYKVASPDDSSITTYGGFPKPVYKPKNDYNEKNDSPRKDKNKKKSKYTITLKYPVGKYLHIKETEQTVKTTKQTVKTTKLTKGKKFWKSLVKSKDNHTKLEEPKPKSQSKLTLQDVANCLEPLKHVSILIPLHPPC
ncbi:12692_t:CDS:2 [Racocetra fulgida]|uniref:12692_t:CDS:1 n=1 Tax=Racocetra fulgida TaxID=60492 RepID=A0A9N9EHC0_9GLOM|nr:12692_t:CDS:2 [Racocetra fulgida]